MKKKGLNTTLTVLFFVVCILFPLVSVSAVEQVAGIDTLFENLQVGELPIDSVIGKLIEPNLLSYEYSLSEIIHSVFISQEGSAEFDQYIDEDTRLMFSVLHGDTIIPMLPAESLVLGRIVLVNDTARVPIRLFFQNKTITGDIFFIEKSEGWKILSADFDFSEDNY